MAFLSFVSFSLLLFVIGCRAHLDNSERCHCKIINVINKTLVQNKVTFPGPGTQGVDISFGGAALHSPRCVFHWRTWLQGSGSTPMWGGWGCCCLELLIGAGVKTGTEQLRQKKVRLFTGSSSSTHSKGSRPDGHQGTWTEKTCLGSPKLTENKVVQPRYSTKSTVLLCLLLVYY